MSQNQQILNHLKSGKSITPMEAFIRYGITCLAERCRDIRKKGIKIDTEIIHKGKKRFAKYSL